MAELAERRTEAQRALAFEEIFVLQLALAERRRVVERTKRTAPYEIPDDLRVKLAKLLPFKLTDAQKRVLLEIKGDLTGPHPMNRLLQGDVGSGKTIVALFAYDFKGELVWKHDLGAFKSQHGHGFSPIVVDGKVIVNNDQDGKATLQALDAKTGEMAWEVKRPAFRTCYSTPFVHEQGPAGKELVVVSTAGITGYGLADGQSIWNYTWSFPVKPLRTVGSGLIADRVGRARTLGGLAVGIAMFSGFAPTLMEGGPVGQGAFILIGFALLGLSYGQAAGAVTANFGRRYRYTGAALTSDLAWLIGAGFAPLVALGLCANFGLSWLGAYLLSGALGTLIALGINRAKNYKS